MASLPYPRHPLNNPPTDGTDAHRCLGCVVLSHGTRRIHRNSPLQENSVNSVGSTFQQEASVCSVNSVGRCNGCSVGAAETAAPPGWVRVAALNNPPTDGTDAHRCLGCALSHRTHRSLLLWEDAVAAWLVQFLVGWCSSCSGKRQSRAETSAPPGTAPLKGSVGMAGCHTLL